jgi:hypothetical protein
VHLTPLNLHRRDAAMIVLIWSTKRQRVESAWRLQSRSQQSCVISASIAVYRPQAEFSGGRFDGKLSVVSVEVSLIQILIRA